MKIHICMPFSRYWLESFWLRELRPLGLTWYPVTESAHVWPQEDWIKPVVYKREECACICAFAFNKFLETVTLVDDDFYMFLSDDDFWEPGFWGKLANIVTDFIVVSCQRGQNQVGPYPTTTLWAAPENMAPGLITGCQLIMKGKTIRGTQFQDNWVCDGHYIKAMWDKYPHSAFNFRPDANTYFNYLQPGRWKGSPAQELYNLMGLMGAING